MFESANDDDADAADDDENRLISHLTVGGSFTFNRMCPAPYQAAQSGVIHPLKERQ